MTAFFQLHLLVYGSHRNCCWFFKKLQRSFEKHRQMFKWPYPCRYRWTIYFIDHQLH